MKIYLCVNLKGELEIWRWAPTPYLASSMAWYKIIDTQIWGDRMSFLKDESPEFWGREVLDEWTEQ